MSQKPSQNKQNFFTQEYIQKKYSISISLEDAEEISNSLIQYSQVLLEIAQEHGMLDAYVEISKQEREDSV